MTDNQERVFANWFEKTGMYVQKNGKVRGAGNNIITVSKIRSKWEALRGYSDDYFQMDEADIQDFIVDRVAKVYPETDDNDNDGGPTMAERRQRFREMYTELYDTEEDGVSIKTVSKKFHTGLPVSDSSIVNNIRGLMMDENFPPPSKEDCLAMISGCKEEAINIMRQDKLDAVKYDPDLVFDFKSWTKDVFGFYRIEDTALNRRMFKHMMHQTKRSAFCKFTEQDFMFLFYSKIQGIGKSRLVKHLAMPFYNGLNDSATLQMLRDDNTRKALFSDSPAIIDFKEMGLGGTGSSEGFAAEMKAFMDMKVFKTRQMFADYMVDSYAYATWVSSTNLHVEEVIKDTDYRRFYSFDFGLTTEDKKAYNKDNTWAKIDDFFNTTLMDAYRSLDENVEPPKIQGERYNELCDVQSGYANRVDTVQQFVEDQKLKLVEVPCKDSVDMPMKLLYAKFKAWCKDTGVKQYSMPTLEILIFQSIGVRTHKDDEGKKCYNCIVLGDET